MLKLWLILTFASVSALASENYIYVAVDSKYPDVIEVKETIEVAKNFSQIVFKGTEVKCKRAVSDEAFHLLKQKMPELFEILNCTIGEDSGEAVISFTHEGSKADFHGIANFIRIEK